VVGLGIGLELDPSVSKERRKEEVTKMIDLIPYFMYNG